MSQEAQCSLNVLEARGFIARALGLLIKNSQSFGTTGLLFKNCNSVHTWFMRENIDILFCDRNFVVIRSYIDQRPGIILKCRGAYAVIERFSSDRYWPKEGEKLVITKLT